MRHRKKVPRALPWPVAAGLALLPEGAGEGEVRREVRRLSRRRHRGREPFRVWDERVGQVVTEALLEN